MSNCDDPTPGERISLALIPVGCAVMEFLRWLRRPASAVTALLVAAVGAMGTAKEYDWPHESWWKPGQPALVIFVILSLLAGLGVAFIIVGFFRLLSRETRRRQFQAAAHSFVRCVEKQTSLQHHEIGVNIWLIKGVKGFRRLVREAIAVAEPRPETPITWTKGKGIIGHAWRRNKSVFANLDTVRALFNEETWCALRRDQRFRLSWDEFNETWRYHAVLAVPLRRHRFGVHRIRGILAIDAVVTEKGKELDGIQRTPDFNVIMGICQAAFAGSE
jgi:phosphate/sulfate permease